MKVDKFEYNRIKNLIIDTVEDLNINTSWFTNYYVNDYDKVENDIELLIETLKEEKVDLYSFMKKYEKEIFADYDFIQTNGFFDSLLYWYDKKKGILSGNLLIDSEEIEYLIKYKYQYYNYDMGIKYILQSYDNLEDYYKDTAEKILIGLIDYCFPIESKKDIKYIVKSCSRIKKYSDSYSVFINLEYLLSSISRYGNTDMNYENFVSIIESNIATKSQNSGWKLFDKMLEIFIGHNKSKISLKELLEIEEEISLKQNTNKYNL